MRQAQGLVASINIDGKAQVMIKTEDSLPGCTSRTEACHCSGGSTELTIKVLNKAGAGVGDYVSVSFVPGAVMKSVLILLGIPLLALIAGVMAGTALTQSLVLSSTGAVIVGSACFAFGVLITVLVYRRVSPDIQPFIDRVISRGLSAAGFLKTVDPVCNMQVDPETAEAKIDYKGNTYYFCNANCLDAFTKEPEKYLGSIRCPHC
ncbi:MAG: SoxR reducing system RseC family protein [Desulfobacteraceae bacterium]|jgi:Cu+-exporting ATPase